ncbi:hypothetical protein QCA50_012403 [Cerrena zonata]|uniref:Uncharacterized protein n=1 Tax=Cerrena zonata TaxID=2478898 RepID=A0AAW0FUG6_9APHY
MSDFERFFKELDRRMDMPDESIDDYLARLAEQRRRSPSIENRDRTDAIVIEDSPPEEATSNKGSNVEIPIDNGTTSRVALPTNNEPIFEITSSKRKVMTNELELSERKDKRIKLSPEPPSCTTSNYNKIAQNPSAQQQGSTSRQGRADLKIQTSKSIPNRHEVRKTPEPGRHITSKESPAPGKTEQPPSNIDNAGTADIVRNRPQPSHSNEKKRAINDSPVLAPKEPKSL